jgi:Lrp/AsnC family leucine-responsive transcriptional regulator
MNDAVVLDATDWRILEELQRDARITWAELGRRIGMSAPAAAERVRHLEESGAITGYHADVDLGTLGYPIVAFVRMDTDARNVTRLAEVVVGIPEVLELNQVTGGEGFILKVAASSVEHLGAVLARLLPLGRTTTSVVLATPLGRRVIEHREA